MSLGWRSFSTESSQIGHCQRQETMQNGWVISGDMVNPVLPLNAEAQALLVAPLRKVEFGKISMHIRIQ